MSLYRVCSLFSLILTPHRPFSHTRFDFSVDITKEEIGYARFYAAESSDAKAH